MSRFNFVVQFKFQHSCQICKKHRRIEILKYCIRRVSGEIFDFQLILDVVILCFDSPSGTVQVGKIILFQIRIEEICYQIFRVSGRK